MMSMASCSSTSAPSVSQPIPEIASGRSDAPLLRPSTRGDRGVALSSASSATSRQLALDGLLTAMSAPSAADQNLDILPHGMVRSQRGGPGARSRKGVRCLYHVSCGVGTCLLRTTFPRSRICTLGKVLTGPCDLREHSFKSKRAVNRGIGPARQLLILKQHSRH